MDINASCKSEYYHKKTLPHQSGRQPLTKQGHTHVTTLVLSSSEMEKEPSTTDSALTCKNDSNQAVSDDLAALSVKKDGSNIKTNSSSVTDTPSSSERPRVVSNPSQFDDNVSDKSKADLFNETLSSLNSSMDSSCRYSSTSSVSENLLFETLRSEIPSLREDKRASKMRILEETIARLKSLQRDNLSFSELNQTINTESELPAEKPNLKDQSGTSEA